MISQTNEAALETHIENALAKGGYRNGNPAGLDRRLPSAESLGGYLSKLPKSKRW